MARVQSPPILAQLRTARTYGEQIAALRSLKNEIIGHVQKKEKWVEAGILEPVVKVLIASRAPGKLNGKDSRTHAPPARNLTEEESVRLQALQALSSFALGGPSFLAPIQASGAVSVILANVAPIDNPPQVILAGLKALVSLVEASTLAPLASPVDLASLADAILVPPVLDAFNAILTSPSPGQTTQSQITLVSSLISRLCREEKHQVALTDSGLLDAFATRLASLVVATGYVIPGADAQAQKDGVTDLIPDAAAPGANLAVTLEAISTILGDSRWRASALTSSPSIMAVFPNLDFNYPPREAVASLHALDMVGLGKSQQGDLGAMDCFLPVVSSHHTKGLSSQASPFPPVGTVLSRDNFVALRNLSKFNPATPNWDASQADFLITSTDTEVEDPESPLVPWLIHLVRTTGGADRVMAASVLVSLFKAGFTGRSRETDMGVFIVPLLVQLLNVLETAPSASEASFVDPQTASLWALKERTLAVLARLITDSEFLQKCAFECHAAKTISRLLKDAYEILPSTRNAKPWSPTSHLEKTAEHETNSATCRLGPDGQQPLHAHWVRVRESALKAVAALASFKDEYRKAFVDQEVMPYIVESLKHIPSKPKANKENSKISKAIDDPMDGDANSPYGNNPTSVIIAACHAVRMLSRSISVLRTELEDHGVASPILRLLRHPDIDVQVAACAAICNLLTEVSPMRQPLTEAGVMKILCEHAHSLNASLRLNALWALKHLIGMVGSDLKKSCLEELESGWLVQLICDDTEDDALFARTKNDRQGSGNDMDEDVEMDQSEEDSKSWLASPLQRSSTPRSGNERARCARMRHAERKTLALRESEVNPVRKARNDDLAIQEQGLNFIRNLIGPVGPGASPDSSRDNTEMIDYLFSQLGQDRLFGILESKLQVKFSHPFSRRFPSTQDSRVLYPQAKIIEAVIYVLVHMAASVPRHRQVVITQTKLLQDLGKHFASKDKEVRLALCHLITNLTWQDDSTDEDGSRQRAAELKRLGLLGKLETLEQDDGELDIRERAKAAIWQINKRREY